MRNSFDIEKWVKMAEGDLLAAELLLKTRRKGAFGWIVAFHSQQAVEKLIKALQIKYTGNYQSLHNLSLLAESVKSQFEFNNYELDLLSGYYVRTRYPSLEQTEISLKEGRRVFEIAKRLSKQILKKLEEQ